MEVIKAWDLMNKYPNSGSNEVSHSVDFNDIEEMMIEFAKLHVKAALEQAANNAQLRQGEDYYDWFDDPAGSVEVAEDTILNAYPLKNIK